MTSVNNYESVELATVPAKTKHGFFHFGGKKTGERAKLRFVLRKKHVIVAALVMVLTAAVYVNYLYSVGEFDLTPTGTKNYGDSLLVATGADDVVMDADAYFSEARISKEQNRDEAVETIQNLSVTENLTEEQLAQLTQQASAIAASMELETKLESLIKAKGFEDCLVYITNEYADVIVKTEGLLAAEAAAIKESILQETEVPVENITIVEVS
ncbi:MAG TPA: SpoIIIAH-like family protein [Oscillospiraceae bacterium]|mgnify:CR=1 FL=1|nr:SpoIIIAH-like family protein [Oscillospiraceae bacterium]HNW04728.1 SpoIIIAH-like family protein [Oscillospiraceae bacterium]HPV99784.1 SpoIIIAH-like family protein [Oscillospiraceae bacterium]